MAQGSALAVNCGSSSIKFKLYSSSSSVLLSGSASNIGSSDDPINLSFKTSSGSNEKPKPIELSNETSYEDVFERILDEVQKYAGGGEITVVAHRIVHGGKAREAIVIHHGDKEEKETLDRMDEVSEFAPLHNHHAMLAVRTCLSALPSASSVLCFDTLFHSTIPPHLYTYPISQPPHSTPVPLRRYGFHGLSYGSVARQMSDQLGVPVGEVNLVVAHLGSGGSVCLIVKGESRDTSMGLTPLEGLPGGTRAGSLDPSLVFHHTPDCSDEMEWSGRKISKAEWVMNKESGFKALAGTTDFGTITKRAFASSSSDSDDRNRALLAYNLYLSRLTSFISSYLSTLFSLNLPLHGLIFTGGIGEHSVELRRDVLKSLEWIEDFAGTGGGLDEARNEEEEGRRRITREGSRVGAWVVETDEESEAVRIAREAVGQK
ncbi:acetate kinase [Pseudohyphozyma bogoriensis]|nr:acetate kinase [Pseudohyphozyma bogoriensis]